MILELLPGISSILQIFDTVFSIREKFNSEKAERRESISLLLEELSTLIEEIANDLNEGKYPSGKCAKMEYFTFEIYDVLKGKIAEEKAKTVFDWVKQAVNVEQLLFQLSTLSEEERAHNIDALHIVSGKISAFATLLKVAD